MGPPQTGYRQLENSLAEKRENDSEEHELEEAHVKLVQYFQEAETATFESRQLSERDRDYYDHKQFTADELAEFQRRKQPAIQVNRIKPKVDFLLGMERQMRTDPRAFPRTPIHEDAAESATESLRYVMDNNDFDYIRSDVFENMLVEGTGGAEVIVKPGRDGLEVIINQYPWDRIFYDMHSRRRDFSDAKYMGGVIWMDVEDAKELGNIEAIENSLVQASGTETYDDTPRYRWVDSTRNRIRICSIWYKDDGVWNWALFTQGGIIQGGKPSPFTDENGEPQRGMELQSAFVDREGYRYGSVRPWIDIQDEINKRRSKALHLLTMRQTLSEQGAVTDINEAKRELAKPDGHIVVQPNMRFEVLDTNDLATGQFQLLQEAKQEIDAVGANAALQGKEERNMSGRALLARQQSGATELGPVFDSLRAWQKRIYRQAWNRIQQYWTEERWIRVTDDENNMKWVGLNRTITVGEQMEQEFGPVPPQFANDPRLQIPVAKENDLAALDVDIILDDAPDTITLQSEQFEMLVQMYQANPQAIPFEMIVEASSLPNKSKLLDRMKGEDVPPEVRQQQQQAETDVMDMQKRGAEAEIAATESKAFRDKMDGLSKISQVQQGEMGLQ